MSLINEALKRAREAQGQTPEPPPAPQLRPVEPAQQARHGLGLVLPAAFAIVALLVLLFAWQYAQRGGPARKTESAPSASTATRPQTVSAPLAATTETRAAEPSTPVAPQAAANSAGTAVATQAAVPAAPTVSTESNTPPAAIQPLSQPPPLRLQGIVYNPASPSAMISGKTVFVGDRLGDKRVVAINQLSATLVGNGETNVLTLAQ